VFANLFYVLCPRLNILSRSTALRRSLCLVQNVLAVQKHRAAHTDNAMTVSTGTVLAPVR